MPIHTKCFIFLISLSIGISIYGFFWETIKIDREYQKMFSAQNGYYKFLDVPDGEYLLSVKNDAYENVEIPVELKDGKLQIKDIKLAAKKGEVAGKQDYSKDSKKLWAKLKDLIKDEKILSQLDGYEISGVETKGDINKIISELEKGDAKLTGLEITVE